MTAQEALKLYFGYDNFRKGQEEIINSITSGENIVAVLPTGAGKSLCFQIPTILGERFSIVISPLIALMKDQVDAINRTNETQRKIAAYINSSLSYAESEQVLREINEGQIKLLYLAPERLESSLFAEKIKNLNPEFLFVDEAHCISEWGHNFRPSYRKIKEFAEYISLKKISAFTATATPEVIQDIVLQLGLDNPRIVVKGFERDNLSITVIKTKNKKEQCLDLISKYKTPAIIYASSRKSTEEVAGFLNLYGLSAAYYHAGMEAVQRKHIQEEFIADRIKIIVATTAFGMGIDKKDIRLIIHYNMPGSIENYYQEIGRAGRDGKESYVVMLYEGSDKHIHKYFIENSYPDEQTIISVYNSICDYYKVAVGNSSEKEIPIDRQYISGYLKLDISKAKLAAAVSILEQSGYLKAVSEFHKKHTAQINIDSESLKRYLKTTTNYIVKDLLIYLLRRYGKTILSSKTNISIDDISAEIGTTPDYVEDVLAQLNNTGILDYNKPLLHQSVTMPVPRVSNSNLNLDIKKLEVNYQYALSKLDCMVEYVNTDECRMKYIIGYFGEIDTGYSCQKCDLCLDKQEEFVSALHQFELTDNKTNNTYEENLELFNKLREARTAAAQKFQQSSYLICSDDILRKIADAKPSTPQAMLSVKGITQKMFNKIGLEFLHIIEEFLKDKQLIGKDIPDNVRETYRLVKQGYDLNSIAELRKLTSAIISMQIETILEYDGQVDVSKLFNDSDYQLIFNEIQKGFIDLRDLKSRLPSHIGYPFIRIAVARHRSR